MSRLFGLADREVSADAWFTPKWIFDGLGLTFDLDVAAPAGGPLHVPCREWFCESDDGLTQPWHGVIWCNPPYSAPTQWCDRYAQHPDGIILVRADVAACVLLRCIGLLRSQMGPPEPWRSSRDRVCS